VELPDFRTLRSDTLYEKFADIFVPKNSLTEKEVLVCFRPNFWRPNRGKAYMHLYSSYGDEFSDQDLSDDAGQLIRPFALANRQRHGLSDDEADDGLEAVR
jgi:hypothetical protein